MKLLATIAVDLGSSVMVPVPVKLDDKALPAPERVDLPARDPCVDLREGNTGRLAQQEESDLERTARLGKSRLVALERISEQRGSGPALAHSPFERFDVEQPAVVSLGKGKAHLSERRCCGKVDNGAGYGSDGESPVTRLFEVPRVVNDDPRRGPRARRAADLDAIWRFGDELPPPCGGCVAEYGARPRVQKGGDEATFHRHGRMAECVDTSMNDMQLASGAPSPHRARAYPAVSELLDADYAPLAAGNVGRVK
jgi:hypothetical protein